MSRIDHGAVKVPRRAPPVGGGAIARLVVAGALLGPGLGIALGPRLAANRLPLWEARIPWLGPAPARGDWSRPRGAGESAASRTVGGRTILVARAPTAAGAEALALELALPRLSRSPELVRARDAHRASWAASLLSGPAATLTPAGDCAARLRGWAAAWSAVVAPTKSPAGPRGRAPVEPLPAPSGETPVPVGDDIPRLALATDAPGLENALVREARVARSQLFTSIGSLPAGQREAATAAWRREWGRRAAELDTLAEALAARKPRIERELIARIWPVHALGAETRIPDPGVILLLAASGSEPAAARPVTTAWLVFAAAGSALGLMVAWPLARNSIRGRRARHQQLTHRLKVAGQAFAAIPPPASAAIEARLLIVSGSIPRRVAHAARELAARCIAEGERVLMIDGGRDLRLHDSFGAQPRLGFQECMRDDLPVLGVLQNAGLPGLYIVAHGAPSRLGSWMPLGGLLDQARPYFSRVVLALDASVPRQAGEALAGRLMDGWWAARDVRRRDARRFSTRIGIALQAFEPTTAENATLEAMVEAFERNSRSPAASRTAVSRAPAIGPAPAPADEAAPIPVIEAAAIRVIEAAPAPAVEAAPAPAVEAGPIPVIEAAAIRAIEAAPTPAVGPAPATAIAHAHVVASSEEAAFAEAPANDAAGEVLAVPPAVLASAPAGTPALTEGPVAPDESLAAVSPAESPALEPALAAVERVEAFASAASAPAAAPEFVPVPGLPPAPALATAAQPASTAGIPAGDPMVLESDPEVSERLRFLVWMRRLRDKSRREVAHAG